MKITNILVVEDERITAKDIKNSLEKVGYNVPAMVATGEDAIQFSDENRPDLVIMDIKLEGNVDGIEAAETIRSKFSIPVIYLTSYSDENTVERAKSTHPSAFILKEPFGFLHKPFEENELLSAIDIILYRNNEENKLKSHEKLLSSVLKTISDGVIAADLDGRIKFMNKSAEKLTGQLEQDCHGKNLVEIIPGIKLKKDIQGESNLIDFFDGESLLKSKNNEYITIEGTLTPLTDEKANNSGIIVIFRSALG
jgi:PAS domain S-box-containing protein